MALVQNPKETRSVTNASAQFSLTMVGGVQYVLRATTDLWYALGSNPTAAANTTGSSFLAKGQTALVAVKDTATKIAVIRDSADGYASIDELIGGTV